MAAQTEKVIEAIMDRIDHGLLLPGQGIDEKQLMAEFGVSRTPMREALIRLETEGLVQRHPRRGAVLFRPGVTEFLTILEVHAQLESAAAELAALRIDDTSAAALRANVVACRNHADTHGAADPAGYYQLNLRFHEIVATAACNPVLLHLIKINARKLMAYFRLRYRTPGATLASAREHAQIAHHIEERRSTQARAAMVAHFNYDRQTVMDLIASVG